MNSGDVSPEVNRYFRAEERRRGPREQCRNQSQFVAVSGPVLGGHGAQPVGPWANGRRQGVPAYVPAAPLAPGGVSGRLEPNCGSRVDRVCSDEEVAP